jgi:protein-S-isoprenylcysteine O-methyltransferase Ste14
MFPVLVWMYVRLARSEEADTRARFGQVYKQYAQSVPSFFPRFAGAGSEQGGRKI